MLKGGSIPAYGRGLHTGVIMNSQKAIRLAGIALAGLAGALAAGPSLAQTSASPVHVTAELDAPAQDLVNNKFVINAGVFVLQSNLKANLNGNATAGSGGQSIDFDQTFGTNADATRVRADILWRFLPRHHLRFVYFDNDVSRTRTLDHDVVWGDYTFQNGASVTAENKLRVYELAYEYAFARGPTYEVVGSAGIHYSQADLTLSGSATITDANGGVSEVSYQSKTSSLPAPLPVLGVRGQWAFARNWSLEGSGQFFKVKIDNYDGSWWDFRAGVTWMFSHHVGAGAGYDRFLTHVNVERPNFSGNLNTGYAGALIYLTGTF